MVTYLYGDFNPENGILRGLFYSRGMISFSASLSPSGQNPSITLPVANYALSGKTFQTETEVAESYKCLVMCQTDAKCKSFNFSKKDKICELNTATKKEFPRNYIPRKGYSYFQMNSGTIKVARRSEL